MKLDIKINSPTTFGRRMKICRKLKNINQDILAKKIGKKKSIISLWETSDKIPKSMQEINDIAAILETSPEYLLGQTDIINDKENKSLEESFFSIVDVLEKNKLIENGTIKKENLNMIIALINSLGYIKQ